MSILTGFQGVYVNRVFHDRYHSATLGDQSHDDHFWASSTPSWGWPTNGIKSSLVYLSASRSFQPPSFDESLGIQEGVDGGQVFTN